MTPIKDDPNSFLTHWDKHLEKKRALDPSQPPESVEAFIEREKILAHARSLTAPLEQILRDNLTVSQTTVAALQRRIAELEAEITGIMSTSTGVMLRESQDREFRVIGMLDRARVRIAALEKDRDEIALTLANSQAHNLDLRDTFESLGAVGTTSRLASAPEGEAEADGHSQSSEPRQSPAIHALEAERRKLLDWAVCKWHNEVSNRPLANVHRRTLDDTWRQVIRYAGGDPVKLVGPAHDDLLAEGKNP